MVSCSELRARARKTLGGNIFKPQWLCALLLMLVVSIIEGVTASTVIIALLLTGPISVGVASYFLNMIRKEHRTENAHKDIGAVLDGFNTHIDNTILAGFLVTLFTALWSLLFVIPGIVKSYSYAMTFYIRKDHPEYTATQAITESRKMMDGYKLKLFLLDLSFIGWIIVGALCLGIGILWVIPYMEAARAHFYEERRAEQGNILYGEAKEAPEA